ncbi:hypothetical protein B0H19DRAFT_1150261 [Mycena capillaripes]|nr:hypothetical protein B0H19DRAFT_1150261 [Mycena capillaripes]
MRKSPRISWTPNIHLFDADAVKQQKESTDLVILCPSLRIPVRIHRPTIGGHKVRPEQILAFLQREGLHWPCFCALLSPPISLFLAAPSVVSTRIIHSPSDGDFVVCGYNQARCSFFIDLGAIHDSTDFHQEYQTLPIELGVEQAETLQLGAYLLCPEIGGNLYPGAQRFPGYWGEFHPHIRQAGEMASVLGVPALPPTASDAPGKSHELAATEAFKHQYYTSVAIQVDSPLAHLHAPALNFYDSILFSTLARGAGISAEMFDNLFTICHTCNHVFVARGVDIQAHRTCCGVGPSRE